VKRHHQPSGLRNGLDPLIDSNWTPEQACAVVELLDDLRDRIWSHYEPTLLDQLRNDRVNSFDVGSTDPPF
jgi:hypothetical protein